MMKVFIGGAWPYANGSLHIGHVAALLPGDILARYFRLKGSQVCYVSGSDCHGTPIQLRARQEGRSPQAIADYYHKEFEACFKELGFSYDLYNRTDDSYHKEFVSGFFHKLLDSGYIYRKTVEQAFCPACHQFLPDRFVIGSCPTCGSTARGDQCDSCGNLLDPGLLDNRKCSICQVTPIFKPSEHFFLALSHLEEFIQNYVNNSQGWRTNALRLSQRYLNEGLQDRAVTRDLDWGIDVPLDGYKGKKIYVWVEAVLGYLSASRKWALNNNANWTDFWSEQSVHYYVHGKDNIPFHTIILPALLKAYGGLHLPDRIISSEYCTLEGRKISTSENWAVWIPDLLKRYHPDSIRYFFTINGPEKRDTNFSWQEFILRHNSELLGAFGNFVHRSLVFLQKYYSNRVPQGQCDKGFETAIQELYTQVGAYIEAGRFKKSLEEIFTFVRAANKYFDEQQPWLSIQEKPEQCADTLYTCLQVILNLSNILEPFLPFSCQKIRKMLGIEKACWQYRQISSESVLSNVEILFERIDKERINEEIDNLTH